MSKNDDPTANAPSPPSSSRTPRRPVTDFIMGLAEDQTGTFRDAPEAVMAQGGLIDGEQRVVMSVEPDVIAAFARVQECLDEADEQATHDAVLAKVQKLREAAEAAKAAGWPGPGVAVSTLQPPSARGTDTLAHLLVTGNGLMDGAIVRFVGPPPARVQREFVGRLVTKSDYMRRTLVVRDLDLHDLPRGTYDVEVTNALGLPAAKGRTFTIK